MKLKKNFGLLLAALTIFTSCGNNNDKAEETKKEQAEEAETKNSAEENSETENAEKSELKDGTYTGTATGHQGPVEVEVLIKDGKISNLDITKTSESPGVKKALEIVPERIIEAQSYNVDEVTGATFASKAIINATKKAMLEAGASENDYSETVSFAKDPEESYEADVIVIGGGGSGLASAVSAHQNGASVLVIEKLGQIGGSTVFSGGAFNAADQERAKTLEMSDLNTETVESSLEREAHDDYEKQLQDQVKKDYEEWKNNGSEGMFDSAAFHALQTYNGGDYKGTPELIDVLTKNALEAVDWVEELGAHVDDNLGMATGALWERSHYGTEEYPNGTYLIDTFNDYIENNDNIDIHLNTQAKELIEEDGKIVGVKAESNGKEVIYKANNAVIMATGGFGANVEMRQKYNEQWADLGSQIGCSNSRPCAQGEGITMAENIGAQLTDMGLIQLHPNGQEKTGMMMGQPHTSGLNRIFINNEGDRFVAEDARRDVLVNAIYDQPDGNMWIVADGNRYPEGNEKIKNDVETGRTFKAETVEELAEMIGVPADHLQASIDQYNGVVDGKKDPFGLVNFDKKLGVPPFYAAKRLPTVHHTMGGLKINTEAQVLDKNDKPIPGFYAAGEVTGGIHGGNRLGGNAITDIDVFGRIAGENAAKNK